MTDLNGNPAGHDHLCYGGAVELAKRLRQYWLARGYKVTTTVETVTLGQRCIHSVRSNLISGIPPESAKIVAMAEAA